jgi:L-lactate dehydrogenase complex protein LldG
MMENQNSFLRTIRAALGQPPGDERSKTRFPDLFALPDLEEPCDTKHTRTAAEQEELVEILVDSGNQINISTHIAESFDEAAAVIVELIRSKDPEFNHNKHIVLHDHPDIAALNLWNRFSREGVTLHTTFSSDRQIRDKTIASFIGITAPAIGVADSATLIEQTEPGRPRSTSLVPSIHIAFLRRENLVADMSEAYVLLQEKKHLDSFVFISGPSKTADIEAHLVFGAHGPCELHLIVLSGPVPEEPIIEVFEEQSIEVTEEIQEDIPEPDQYTEEIEEI